MCRIISHGRWMLALAALCGEAGSRCWELFREGEGEWRGEGGRSSLVGPSR